MKARFSRGQFAEIEISGNHLEWAAFALALSAPDIDIPCEISFNPAPYDCVCCSIRVRDVQSDKLRLSVVAEDAILIEGNVKTRSTLAATATNLATEFLSGNHLHIEYQGDEHFISQDSIPVVFTLTENSNDAHTHD